jgi:hypothetical protein
MQACADSDPLRCVHTAARDPGAARRPTTQQGGRASQGSLDHDVADAVDLGGHGLLEAELPRPGWTWH